MSGRGASSAYLAELGQDGNIPIHLVSVHFDEDEGGIIYLTNYFRDITWNGNLYAATGHLLNFSGIEETSALQVATMSIELSGVDQAYVSAFLSKTYIDRTLKVYNALINTTGSPEQVVVDPVLWFEGRMDEPVMEEDVGAGTSTVAVTVTNHWTDFDRHPGRRTNHEDLNLWFPGDKGFEFASEVSKQLLWGR